MTELKGAIALVTGASRGIGAATAIELARHGAHVVITGRTQGGLEETDDAIRAAGGAATLLPLDLCNGAAVDAIGPSIYERFGRLDVLVHCAAALGKLTPVPHILPRDWDRAVGVNLSATLALIRTAAPLLLAAEAGRAVFVTTNRASHPTAYWGTYGATKAALEHLALTWAAETTTTRLRVNLFDPGVVATRLRKEAFPGEDLSALKRPEDVAPELAALCLPAETRHGEIVRTGNPVAA
jgi:NAD(P)-dependent dehydrogenase (short-subunit alcohol dehydrogenase family)